MFNSDFRYLKRMARHGVIRKDPIFRAFIQEKEPPKELKSGKTFSEMLTGIKETLGNIGCVHLHANRENRKFFTVT